MSKTNSSIGKGASPLHDAPRAEGRKGREQPVEVRSRHVGSRPERAAFVPLQQERRGVKRGQVGLLQDRAGAHHRRPHRLRLHQRFGQIPVQPDAGDPLHHLPEEEEERVSWETEEEVSDREVWKTRVRALLTHADSVRSVTLTVKPRRPSDPRAGSRAFEILRSCHLTAGVGTHNPVFGSPEEDRRCNYWARRWWFGHLDGPEPFDLLADGYDLLLLPCAKHSLVLAAARGNWHNGPEPFDQLADGSDLFLLPPANRAAHEI
ncbi:hypothetical protein B296_00039418, partial [Ensete ventricosum]